MQEESKLRILHHEDNHGNGSGVDHTEVPTVQDQHIPHPEDNPGNGSEGDHTEVPLVQDQPKVRGNLEDHLFAVSENYKSPVIPPSLTKNDIAKNLHTEIPPLAET